MNTQWFGVTLAAMQRVWLFPVIAIGIVLVWYRCWWRICIARSVALQFLQNFSFLQQVTKAVLLTISLLFLQLALLQPQWNAIEENIEQKGRDLLVALDVSRSMLAEDMLPNRLERVKQKVRALLKQLSCERVGLLLFSGSTFVQCPLTADYNAFYLFLDQVDVETISSGTTALDSAITHALKTFEQMPERKHKLLLLCTDGEDFSRNLSNVKQKAAELNMHIFALGAGTPEGAPIPLFDNEGNRVGHQKDKKGSIVISKLNDPLLADLAQESGGVYTRITQDNSDVHKIVQTVHQFEKEKLDERTVKRYEDQYPYFLVVSFICLLLEWLL